MFYFLFKKEYWGILLLISALGFYLFFIDLISEKVISSLIGNSFFYQELPFLKLVYLVLLVVTLGLFISVDKNEKISEKQKVKGMSSYLLILLIGSLAGILMHIFQAKEAMINEGSLSLMENSYLYFIHDYALLLAFLIGGLVYLKKLIHAKS